MRIAIMGPPGGGKGTQAEILSADFSIPHISTGAIIRNEIRNQSVLGQQAESYISNGQLVPDDVMINMISERLKEDDCKKGYILDGFPRTLIQAEAMDKTGAELDCVLNLVVDDAKIVERLSGRRECKSCAAPYHTKYKPPKKEGICDKCGGELIMRPDDNPDIIHERLSVYHKQTEPLIDYYKKNGKLRNAVGLNDIEATTAEVYRVLGVERK